jgi:branched-chain amino acid transport system substrate-binding protein
MRLRTFQTLGTLVAVAGMLAGIAQAARGAEPAEVNAIISLTGPAAFFGASEAAALRVAETAVNAAGGIRGRPLKFTILDDQSSPQVAVQLTNQLLAKNANVIMGPIIGATCGAISGLLVKGPVDYCLSPAIHPPAGSFQFSAGVSASDYLVSIVRYFRLNGLTNLALISTTDASGQDFDHNADPVLNLPENRDVKALLREHFAPTDISVAAQVAHIKAAHPQAIIAWTTGTATATLLHGLRDEGVDLPVFVQGVNMDYRQLEAMDAFLPTALYFSALRAAIPGGTRPGPILDAQNRYFAAFKAAGVKPDTGGLIAWDTAMLVVDALRAVGTDASAESVRAWMSQLHGWAGASGLYDFRSGDQRGIGVLGAQIFRWDREKKEYIRLGRPAGYLR